MPPVPRAETTLAEARANPDALHLDRVFRETDRRFWDLWREAGGSEADACLVPMPSSWWEGYSPFKIEPLSALVLHHTAEDTDEECIALFQKPESKVSSHFLVGRDGRRWQFVSLEHRAWHEHIAPDRKNDPGALFPWNEVVRRGLDLAHELNHRPGSSSP